MLKLFPHEIDEPLARAALRSHGDSRGVRRSQRSRLTPKRKRSAELLALGQNGLTLIGSVLGS